MIVVENHIIYDILLLFIYVGYDKLLLIISHDAIVNDKTALALRSFDEFYLVDKPICKHMLHKVFPLNNEHSVS